MDSINIFNSFLNLTILVKFTIFILIIFSILSWAIILYGTHALNIAYRERKEFESKFWSNIELSHIYHESQKRRKILVGVEQIFYSGFKEFLRLNQINSPTPWAIIEGSSRAMRISMNREIEILETYIPLLDIIGSISPYIGLFGTVLGIMHSFITFNTLKQISIQIIAPGIGEALITTAIGLFVAIPAVIAYSYLNQRINKIEMGYNNFLEEFTAILHRQVFNKNEIKKEQNT